MSQAMKDDFQNLSDNDKIQFLLSGMNIKFTPEWIDIYHDIATGIYKMYRERDDQIKERINIQ